MTILLMATVVLSAPSGFWEEKTPIDDCFVSLNSPETDVVPLNKIPGTN